MGLRRLSPPLYWTVTRGIAGRGACDPGMAFDDRCSRAVVGGADASILFMTFIFGLNILTLFEILDILGIKTGAISKSMALGVPFCLFIALYFSLSYNGKSSKILSQYEGEEKKDRLKGRIRVVVYIVLSMALLISTWLLMAMKNRGRM